MLAIRVTLYLVCFFCLSWGALIFAGPAILKSIISTYSQNQLIASSISITPRLDLKIGRLDYVLRDPGAFMHKDGFSRSVNISWSVFGDRPFIDIQFGPTFFDDALYANKLRIYTPAFSELDFNQILLKADIDNLRMTSISPHPSFTIEASFLRNEHLFRDVLIQMPHFDLDIMEPWVLNGITAKIDQIDLMTPIEEQEIIIAISSSKFEHGRRKIHFSNVQGLLTLEDREVEFQFETQELNFGDSQKVSGKLSTRGTLGIDGVLSDAHIELSDSSRNQGTYVIPSLVIDISAIEPNDYNLRILGTMKQTQLIMGEKFVGNLPESNFKIDLGFDNEKSQINVISEVFLKNVSLHKIVGEGSLNFNLGRLARISDCVNVNCKLQNLDFEYTFNVDNEWILITSSCDSPPCQFSSMAHRLKTSNTREIFNIINQSKILNPLYTAYLYSFVSSGTKADKGHEILLN